MNKRVSAPRNLNFLLHFLRLKLKPSLTWSDIKTRLDREFDPDDPCRHDLYESWIVLFSFDLEEVFSPHPWGRRIYEYLANPFLESVFFRDSVWKMRRDSYRFAAQDFVCSGDDGLAPAGMTMRVKTGSHVCDLPLRCFQASLRGPDIKFFCLASRPQSSLKKVGVSMCFRDFNVENHL